MFYHRQTQWENPQKDFADFADWELTPCYLYYILVFRRQHINLVTRTSSLLTSNFILYEFDVKREEALGTRLVNYKYLIRGVNKQQFL